MVVTACSCEKPMDDPKIPTEINTLADLQGIWNFEYVGNLSTEKFTTYEQLYAAYPKIGPYNFLLSFNFNGNSCTLTDKVNGIIGTYTVDYSEVAKRISLLSGPNGVVVYKFYISSYSAPELILRYYYYDIYTIFLAVKKQ
jgi:hypothetical protein